MAWIENVMTLGPVLMVVIIVRMFVSDSMGVVFMGKDMGMLVLVLSVLFGCHRCYGI